MASSGKTEKFGLNQWAEDDYILREDFNADNVKIEEALQGVGNVTVEEGSYVGTGLGGSSVKAEVSLTFDRKPKLLIVNCEDPGNVNAASVSFIPGYRAVFCSCMNGYSTDFIGEGAPTTLTEEDGLWTVSWSRYETARVMLNAALTYRYLVFY